MSNSKRLIDTVEYDRDHRNLKLTLSDGAALSIPVSRIQFDGLDNRPTDNQLAEVQRWGAGTSIYFESLSEILYLDDLKDGVYGDRTWMESLATATA